MVDKNYILLSCVKGTCDFHKIKESLKKIYGVDEKDISVKNKNDSTTVKIVHHVAHIRILLIKGNSLLLEAFEQNLFLCEESKAMKVHKKSYDNLIKSLEMIIEGINEKKEEKLVFNEKFSPQDTVICIHYGGDVGAQKDFELNLLAQKVSQDLSQKPPYLFTFFSSNDGDPYKGLISGEKEAFERSLSFYADRARDSQLQCIKKKMYELMQILLIHNIENYLSSSANTFSTEWKHLEDFAHKDLIKNWDDYISYLKSRSNNSRDIDQLEKCVEMDDSQIKINCSLQTFRSLVNRVLNMNRNKVPIYPPRL